MQIRIKYITGVFLLTLLSCINMTAQSLYFSSPQESVEKTSKLLINENWDKLMTFYFLENTDKETLDSMKNGSYFIRDKKPFSYHPGVSWKYKKPFSPSFKYSNHETIEEDLIKVTVSIEIDQGGGMIQKGMSYFYLLKSKKGYQIKPK